jgi:phage-related protein
MAGLLPPVVAELQANISEFKAKMGEARTEMVKTSKEGGSAFGGLKTVGTAALLGIGGAAIGIAASAVKAALEGQKAHAQLELAVKNTGAAFSAVEPQVSKLSDKFAGFGYQNDQVEESLTRMVQITGDAPKALSLMGTAADLAKARNMDLTAAVTLVGKASEGNVTALKRLGIATKDATGHTITGTQAIAELNKTFGGAAQASAETYAGKMAAFGARMDNLKEKLGNALLPIIAAVAAAFGSFIGYLESHHAVLIALGIAIGAVLVPAFISWAITAGAAAVATIVATAPVIAIGVAIAALAAVIVYLWTHWDQIWTWIMNHKAYAALIILFAPVIAGLVLLVGTVKFLWTNWDQVWRDIQTVTTVVWSVLRPIFDAVKTYIGYVVTAVQTYWAIWYAIFSAVAGVVSTAWSTIAGIFDGLKRGLGTVGVVVNGLSIAFSIAWGTISGIVSSAWSFISGIFSAIVNGVANVVNHIKSIPGEAAKAAASITKNIPIVGSFAGIAGAIFGGAEGMIVPGPTGGPLPIIAHGGEVVLNQGQQANVLMAISRGQHTSGGVGGVTVNANTNASAHDI